MQITTLIIGKSYQRILWGVRQLIEKYSTHFLHGGPLRDFGPPHRPQGPVQLPDFAQIVSLDLLYLRRHLARCTSCRRCPGLKRFQHAEREHEARN